MTKETIYLNLPLLTAGELKQIPVICDEHSMEVFCQNRTQFEQGTFNEKFPFLFYNTHFKMFQCTFIKHGSKTEISFSEFEEILADMVKDLETPAVDVSPSIVALKYNPMTVLPKQVDGEYFSNTVLVYDKDLQDVDLGFYNFDTEKWDVLGGFQMDLICWSEIPKPNQFQVGQFKTHLTD